MSPSLKPPASRPVTLLRDLVSTALALLLAATLVAGTVASRGTAARAQGSGPPTVAGKQLRLVSATRAERIKDALATARRQKGDRYKYGAEGPDRFDCSGLVWFATHRAGFDDVPRTSADQGRYMRHIKRKHLHRGDFVFFTGSSGVYHVGIYVGRRDGDRAVLHAPRPHTRVRVEKVWTDSWFAATLRKKHDS
jgi:cell wall-associated NlpC family hydrolase